MLIKKSILAVLILQLVCSSSVFAKSDSSLDCLARGGCCKVGPAPRGYTYRCYGDNLKKCDQPLAVVKQRLFDNYGVKVGYEQSSMTNDPAVSSHVWVLDCGDKLFVEFRNDADIMINMPVDATIVASFPELAPYLGNPNASVTFFIGNHYKENDPGTIVWNGTGVFKNTNYVEVRCVFLVMTENNVPDIVQSLGCHYFLGFTEPTV